MQVYDCERCDGTGQVQWETSLGEPAGRTETGPCPDCTRECVNCRGTGQRSWPQSRRDGLGRVVERLAPQVTKCGACSGSGVIRFASVSELHEHMELNTL